MAIDISLACPGARTLVGRAKFETLATTTLERFDTLLPPRLLARKYDSHPIWRDIRDPSWPPGVSSRVYFRGVERASSRIGSEEYGWILLEEGHEIRERDVMYLFSRLRHKPEPKWGLVVGFNPLPGWCVDWFMEGKLDPARLEGVGSISFIRSRIVDNPGVDPGYEAMLRAMYPPYLAQRLIDGIAGAVENAIFPQFERSFHVRALPTELANGVGPGGAVDGAIGLDWGRRHIWALVAVLKDAMGRHWAVETVTGEGGRLDEIQQQANYLRLKWHISRGRTDREPLDQVLGFNLTKPNREGRIGLATYLLNHHEGAVLPIGYRGVVHGPQPIPASVTVTDGPLPQQTPGLIIVAGGPGNEELITEMSIYHWDVIETERRLERQPHRVGEDRVAAMEDAIEELAEVGTPAPYVGTQQLGEGNLRREPTPNPFVWPTTQPGAPDAPVHRPGSSEGLPGRRGGNQ